MSSHLNEVWTPPAQIRPCMPEKDLSTVSFFVGPPREIGELLYVGGTLSQKLRKKKLGISVMLAAALLCIVILFFYWMLPSVYVLAVGGVLSVALIAVIVYVVKVYCYFVGSEGVCESAAKLHIPGKPQNKILMFDETAAVFVTKIRQYVNGIYTGTSYKFVWTRQDKTQFVVAGGYHGEEKKRGAGDKYYFAETTEAAWTQHMLKMVDAEFEEKGYVDFPMCAKPKQHKIQTIRMRRGSLEFFPRNGESQTVEINDFKQASLWEGFITFKHKDARWWSGKGSFSFPYSIVPNARLFLICLDRLVGL